MTINCGQTIDKRDRFCFSVALNYVELSCDSLFIFARHVAALSKTSDVTQLHLVQQRCYFEAGS